MRAGGGEAHVRDAQHRCAQTALHDPAVYHPQCLLLTRRVALLAEQLALLRHTIAFENWTYGVCLKVLGDLDRELHLIKHGLIQCYRYGLLLMSAGQTQRARRVMFMDDTTHSSSFKA